MSVASTISMTSALSSLTSEQSLNFSDNLF